MAASYQIYLAHRANLNSGSVYVFYYQFFRSFQARAPGAESGAKMQDDIKR